MNQFSYREPGGIAKFPAAEGHARSRAGAVASFLGKFNAWVWILIIIPSSIAAIYLFLIASNQYISETRFIVRSQSSGTPSMLGSMLQTAGIQRSSDDASAVESFITSRDAVAALVKSADLRALLDRPEADFISRFPNLISGSTFEALYRHYQNIVQLNVDNTTGVMTLQVRAYRPADAQKLTKALLKSSEKLVNELNIRAQADAVSAAQAEIASTERELNMIQQQMTQYRYRTEILDPKLSSTSLYSALGGLMIARAAAATQLAELKSSAPSSPTIPSLESRLRALDSQVDSATRKAAGGSNSIAGKLGEYERLALLEEISKKKLALATQAAETARAEAIRQHLYLEHISEPSLPDESRYPRRMLAFGLFLLGCLLAYGLAWIFVAGVREHIDV